MNYLTKEKAQDLNFIKEIISKAGYKGEVRALVGGSKSFAFAVGDDVVRFPKAEVIWQIMQRENQILREILPLISTIRWMIRRTAAAQAWCLNPSLLLPLSARRRKNCPKRA